MVFSQFKSHARRFFREEEDGVALVEFAIFLPLFVLAFAVIVEFSRIFFSFQGAVVGVRDATRYFARVAPGNICEGATTSNTIGYSIGTDKSEMFYNIVMRNMENEQGEPPYEVVLVRTTARYFCVIDGDYRQDAVPIAEIFAEVEVRLPLSDVFNLNGITIPTIETTISDQSRIFGV
jgi:TadE-like protein